MRGFQRVRGHDSVPRLAGRHLLAKCMQLTHDRLNCCTRISARGSAKLYAKLRIEPNHARLVIIPDDDTRLLRSPDLLLDPLLFLPLLPTLGLLRPPLVLLTIASLPRPLESHPTRRPGRATAQLALLVCCFLRREGGGRVVLVRVVFARLGALLAARGLLALALEPVLARLGFGRLLVLGLASERGGLLLGLRGVRSGVLAVIVALSCRVKSVHPS